MAGSVTPHLLYRFFDEAGELLYVGITVNLPLRLRAHSQRDWWTDVRTMTAEEHPDREAVLVAERVAIEGEHPRHNVCLNRGRRQPRRRVQRCRCLWLEPDAQGVLRCCDCDSRAVFA
jgi:excinuclease UvrABC nuclease subunit